MTKQKKNSLIEKDLRMICARDQRKFRGFTLVEILIVIAILGILLGIVFVSFSGARASARDAVRMNDLRNLEKILEVYKISHNRYPTSSVDFLIAGYAWGSSWENYGVLPKDPLSPRQDYVYVSDDGLDYQIYAKFEREPVNAGFACAEPCGPNAEYNGGISVAGTAGLIAFEPPPPPPPTENGEENGEEEEEEEEGPPPEGGWPVVCNPPFPQSMRGEQTYSVSGSAANPRLTRVIINPLDVNRLAYQTVTVLARDTAGNNITSLQGQAFTSNTSFTFELELIDGTETNGTWQGQWYNEDEYCSNYRLIVRAVSASGNSEAVLTFR